MKALQLLCTLYLKVIFQISISSTFNFKLYYIEFNLINDKIYFSTGPD